MITNPEIICDLFSFLDKDQIERLQLVNQFWNNVIICHKNILPLRQLAYLNCSKNLISLCEAEEDYQNTYFKNHGSYQIKFDGTKLSKYEKDVSFRYSQLTIDEILKILNDVVFYYIRILNCDSGDHLDYLLNMMKLITAKTGSRFRGRFGICDLGGTGRFDSKVNEIVDNYIIVDELALCDFCYSDLYIREVCSNPEIVQLPSTPKEIRLTTLEFEKNEEVLNFTCNGKLNGANRVTIDVATSYTNSGNFIREWLDLYRTHENPISLVGKFEVRTPEYLVDSILDAVKTFLNNTQLRVKYSLETKEFHSSCYDFINQYVKRSCVLHETDSYALVIEMVYKGVTDMSSINASDLDQPSCDQMHTISLCVKPL